MASQQQRLWILLARNISIISQTLFYGIYAALFPFSTHFLLKRTAMTKANKLMFSVTLFMFLLSTAFWVSMVGNEISTIVVFFSSSPDRKTGWSDLYTMFNSLSLINYALTDGVVVWRAWVLCKDDGKKILIVPLALLLLTSLCILATIGIRAAMLVVGERLKFSIDATQMVGLVLSLLTNISATSIIGLKTWHHRHEIGKVLSRGGTQSKVERILVLLVESGFIYCVSGLSVLFASFVRLPHGTLGDIYVSVHVQIAGIYPTIVLVLVSQKRSLKDGVFSTVGGTASVAAARVDSMSFGTNPALAASATFHEEGSSVDGRGDSVELRLGTEREVYTDQPKEKPIF